MVLSDKDIIQAIKSGEIIIDPFSEKLLKPACYTLTLGKVLYMPKQMDLIDTAEELPEDYLQEIKIDEVGYDIQPGEFLIGKSFESVGISKNLTCMLDGRTSAARVGLDFLYGSSTFINPGQEPVNQTLEIVNWSKSPIRIYAGMKAVKAVFMKLSRKSELDYAQMGVYGKKRLNDAMPVMMDNQERRDNSVIKMS